MSKVILNNYRLINLILGMALALAAPPVLAHAPSPRHASPAPGPGVEDEAHRWRISLRGYGELQLAWLDHGANQNRPGGAQVDSRLVFDTTRFVAELEGSLPFGLEFEAEVEIEHHGAGAELELEYEEFGEFEPEVGAGGEVLLEELYLRKVLGPMSLALGRLYLGVGLLSRAYRPTEYLATTRPESEVTVIPAVWDEIGLEAALDLGALTVTLQIVNGLDSTGFSSQGWIATGHQQRFELVSASDLAFVLRADWEPRRGVLVGASAYYGGTSRNRPKADLVPDCPTGHGGEVAPCGYVSGDVALVDLHWRVAVPPFFAQGVVLWGHLENATAISERNARLSNALGVLRTPVADEAFFAWLELGLDVGPRLGLDPGHHLEPFVRFDYYDTMFATSDDAFDNPRFARAVYTAGLGWAWDDLVFAKLDISHRDLGAFEEAALRDETSVRLSTGFGF